MQADLFGRQAEIMAPGAMILRQWALDPALIDAVAQVAQAAPFRHFMTPGGRRIGVEMTNCGALGWVSDARGYRYQATDPQDGKPWPAMPEALAQLAAQAAEAAGFPGFCPDACLINRYVPGVRMGLHQDRDEADMTAPIVSVSLGLPATFQFGGPDRRDPVRRHLLEHGDVVVWGGPARLNWHGILTLRPGNHPITGPVRLNLTFRRAG
ncbi:MULTISPECIES: DNA oxidative demethylase AlkB [unclassified Paracoccus (in: a-proteobacteria)]|uniref:DNA oxidative demethylase AlkB n=1 Tax=unclassified Paracoccus (in: a-proteobacteria) TaxID=2688777 RepID=UPI0012B329D1|nr:MULTISPECIES: DNA oxidative demethylase AlkB [unclassified Paracoccus (in: a-proteobacteria)]UXU76408.1 DNA oxidative demethylase AlkB [Paracoccus sp. SMMA_5]UXU82254.1 DNA oxidative demethylase AlkB [Paracoccus sp. SMMA_5_TC]